MGEKPPCCQPHVVIGLDVGTTYSGACIVEATNCLTHGRHEIHDAGVISKFQSLVAVSLDDNGPKARFLRPREEPHDDEEIQRFFKFDLFYEFNQSAEDTRLVTWVRENEGHEKKKVGTHDAFKTFFEGLFVLALEKRKNRGAPITAAITYPWKLSRSSFSIIQSIVSHSAIPNQCSKVVYGSEAEAALAGTFQLLRTRGPMQEPVIIADCGGLSIDIAVFRPEDHGRSIPPPTTSIAGGGLWLDQIFRDLMEDKISHAVSHVRNRHVNDLEKILNRRPSYRAEILKRWEAIKRNPRLATPSISMPVLHTEIYFSRDEIHGVIHEHVKRLVRIIDKIGDDEVESNERRERPSKVIMTGGLAKISLFYRKVEKQLLRERVGSVYYPYGAVDTWNVVAIGAASFRHQDVPVSRQMEEHEPQDHAMQNSGL